MSLPDAQCLENHCFHILCQFFVIIISDKRVNLIAVPCHKTKILSVPFCSGRVCIIRELLSCEFYENFQKFQTYIFIATDPEEKILTPFLVTEVKIPRLI